MRPGVAGWVLAVALIGDIAHAPRSSAVDDCTRQCRRETAACVAERCAGLAGSDRATCRTRCRGLGGCTKISTLAYVLTECRSDGAGNVTGRQRLQVRRRNCPVTTVMEIVSPAPTPDPLGLCRLYGEIAIGDAGLLAAPFQRIGVSPDGAGVVFEVTDDVLLFPLLSATPEQEGLFHVRADGTGLRRIGPASRHPTWWGDSGHPESPLLGVAFNTISHHVAFSRNGHRVAIADIGPGPDGAEAPQVFVTDLHTGARTQVTRLPAPPASAWIGGKGLLCCTFLPGDTIAFVSLANPEGLNPANDSVIFEVNAATGALRRRPGSPPVATSGAGVSPVFQIVGAGRPYASDFSFSDGTNEVGIREKERALQLTRFGRVDTVQRGLTPDDRRVLFLASADPVGRNPTQHCQLFSVDRLGSGFRQLTTFRESGNVNGCDTGATGGTGCYVQIVVLDGRTREVVLSSSCDPFGVNPRGAQVFGLGLDGRGLVQLTRAAGMTGPDETGVVRVELPGQFALPE